MAVFIYCLVQAYTPCSSASPFGSFLSLFTSIQQLYSLSSFSSYDSLHDPPELSTSGCQLSVMFSCLSMPCSGLMLSLTLARMSLYCKLSVQLIHYFSSERLQFSYSHLYRYWQCCYSFSVCVFMSDLLKPVRRKPGTGNWWFFSLLQLLKP